MRRAAAILYWLGTALFIVGAMIEFGVTGHLMALGGALMLYSINALRSLNE